MRETDETIMINNLELPKAWKCPYCGKINNFGFYAQQIFEESGKVIIHCSQCGSLHIWKLKLTEEFKKSVVDMLLEESEQDE